MRTVLNILNFVLGGFATTLSWLLATVLSIIFIFTLPLTRSCWEITKLSLVPYGNEAIHVDELEPQSRNALLNTGGTLLNILWLVLFGWWLCIMHITAGIVSGSPSASLILKSPLSRCGPSGAEWCLLRWPERRAKQMLAVAFNNKAAGHYVQSSAQAIHL